MGGGVGRGGLIEFECWRFEHATPPNEDEEEDFCVNQKALLVGANQR